MVVIESASGLSLSLPLSLSLSLSLSLNGGGTLPSPYGVPHTFSWRKIASVGSTVVIPYGMGIVLCWTTYPTG